MSEAKTLYVPEPILEEALARTLQVPKGELTEELVGSELIRFQLNGAGIRDITGLEAAVNLQSLSLRDNLIEDVSPILGLAHLRRLDLSGNRLRSLQPLDELAGGALTIRVSEIRKESESPQLLQAQQEALKLELVTILRKSAKGPWQLEELRVSNNRLRGLSGIGKHHALRFLDASNNGLIDLEGISNLSNLEVLHLHGNQLGSVEIYEDVNKNDVFDPGEPFTDLSGNGKRDHDPFGELGNHPRLRELYLYENRITNLASMGDLPRLENLLLGGNELTEVSDLSGLKTLKRLVLFDNHLSDIHGLFELKNLEYLYLTENRLSDLRSLRELTSLRELHIQHNHLTDMRPIANLGKLRVLGLSGNFFNDLSALRGIKTLRRVGLADNNFNMNDFDTEEIVKKLRDDGVRITLGKQRAVVGEMSRLFAVLMGDKVANRLLGDYLKKNRYERLLDYVQEETIPPEEKVVHYETWAKTLKHGNFDPKTPLLDKAKN
ncbi:MAG: leucine-rich repeat domain-containing protein [Opitutales bacterium]